MTYRLIGVDDSYNLPDSVNIREVNLPNNLSAAALSATYATRNKMSKALAAIQSAPGRGIGLGGSYPTTSDAPTLAHGTADTITTNFTAVSGGDLSNTRWSTIGSAALAWNTTYGYLTQGVNGLDAGTLPVGFTLTGTEVEITWRAATTAETQWIWVDGKPTTPAPVAPSGLTINSGGIYRTKLTFATASIRRIEFYPLLGQIVGFRVSNSTSTISPLAARAAKLFTLGDSFLGGSGLIPGLQSWGRRIAFATGMECFQGGQGGTGYIQPGQFGARALTDTSRLNPVIEVDPDLVIIFIGGNDAGQPATTVSTAAASVYSTLRTARPNVPIIVVGTYPCDAANTLTSGRAAVNKAIRDAALAAPNVVGFIDPIGNADTGTVPTGLANGTAYAAGDRYTFQGAIYKVTAAHTGGVTPALDKVQCLTWLTGTGTLGAPAGNGNRDILLSGDGTHWSLLGAGVQAQKIMQGTADILTKALTS